MTAAPLPEIEALIDRLHAQERLRVWSIVITVFGDAVVPRGGELWLGSLQVLLERLRIEPGALRAAMSRLTADGWLVRRRVGRKSFYRLAETGAAEFAAAAVRIYTPAADDWSGGWRIHVIAEDAGDARDARRKALRALGFGSLAPTVFIRPDSAATQQPPPAMEGETVFSARLVSSADLSRFVERAWPLEAAADVYRALISAFRPLERAMAAGAEPDPLSALAARTLLIHDFRRAALRDPLLPAPIRPEDWPGDAARALAARLYARLAPASEAWLDAHGVCARGPLPAPRLDVARRFSGI